MLRHTSSSITDQAQAFLLGRIDYERTLAIPYGRAEFQLDRMRHLLSRLGDPQDRLRIVHVAGTKGKGSTAAMIAATLTAAGYRTGLYTSPHLNRLEERFQIDGQPCSPGQLASLVDQVRPVVEQMDAECRAQKMPEPGPTYFEITTAMALLHFAGMTNCYNSRSSWERVGVRVPADNSEPSPCRLPEGEDSESLSPTDFAVLEVGLGGRLDSTNICRPLVSVITSISFDHTQLLGNTLAKIAAEKAGIIKPGVPVISGVIDEEPRQVIAEVAAQHGCRLIQAGCDFDFQYHPPHALDDAAQPQLGQFDFQCHLPDRIRRTSGINLSLLGRHQAANAAVAQATLDELIAQGWPVSDEAIRRGFASLHWPARIEMVSHRPTIILDAAHNTASIQSLLETLAESFISRRRLLVFATTQEKDVRGMLQLLLPHFEAVILTRYWKNPRAVDIETLDRLAAEIAPIPRFICPDPAAAWRQVLQLATPEHLVCITGSFFLAAEMQELIFSGPNSISHECK